MLKNRLLISLVYIRIPAGIAAKVVLFGVFIAKFFKQSAFRKKSSSEASFGIVPLQQIEGVCHVLMIKHRSGNHWGFPKGHANEGEGALEAAKRELKEETGLTVKELINSSPLIENYVVEREEGPVDKKVTYFLAYVGGNLSLQSEELLDYKWVKVADAESFATFPATKGLCRQLNGHL